MILESIENGPLIWPSIEENRVTRPKKYSELSATEAIQADCDVKATNIIIQGLLPEILHKLKVKQSILLVVLDLNPRPIWRTLLKKTTLIHNIFFSMDSQSAPVVSAAKLPILNPNEFDLWKMRIEQYFLMTDYSLWEVIINGDFVISRVIVDGVTQPVTMLTAKQKLARKNELKAHGTLLMALPDKHQLKFNSHKDAKTVMEAIEKHFRGNTKTKKKIVSQLEIHGVSLSQEDVNLKFLYILPSEWKTHTLIWRNKANLEEHNLDDLFNISAATSVSVVCAKLHVSSHPNIDFLSNAVIFSFFASQSTNPQLYSEDLKQIDVDDLEEIDLRWKMAMECRSPKDSRRTDGAKPHRRTTPVDTSTSNALVSQCDDIGSYNCSYQAKEEPANFALMAISTSSSSDNEAALESVKSRLVVYKKNESILQESIIVLKNEVEARDNFILTFKQKLKQAETERDDLKLKFEKFQSSTKRLTELIASQTNNKHGLGYLSLEDDSKSVSFTCPSDRLSPNGGYHAVSPAKPAQAMSHTTESIDPIIEDWVSDSDDEYKPNDPHSVFVQPIEVPILAATPKPIIKTSSSVPAAMLPKSKPVSVTAVRQVSDVVPKIMKSRPRPSHPLNKKSNPSIRRYQTHNQYSKTSNSSSKVTAAKVSVVSAVKGKKGKWVWRPKCPILDHDSRTSGASLTLK
uniref:Uncharacterized protein n=1 Tax=Tanacetum cinerariifolium TaxID=118510 RepID=A0A699IBL5_TANCI|nr:hypothetical protein [Tanacetum cinerariifolium]